MIRRILVIGSLGLAAVGAGRYALKELTERAWEQRRTELLALALFPETGRRPWELRLESLSERVRTSPRLEEITGSHYRAPVHWTTEEPRPLDGFERVWLESLWGELAGLDGILLELRKQPLEALGWHGETPRLGLARELTNALCGRAWLALEAGDQAGARQAWSDALRLARALDDGTIIATLTRGSSEDLVLSSARAALVLGASPAALRAELLPFFADRANVAERAERAIRRDLSLVADLGGSIEAELDDPAQALRFFRDVEACLAEARRPATELARADDGGAWKGVASAWHQLTQHLHDQHVRRNVAFTALAVAAHRERHGVFPSSLDELALEPEMELDPRTETDLPCSFAPDEVVVGPPSWARAEDGPESGSLYAWTLRPSDAQGSRQ